MSELTYVNKTENEWLWSSYIYIEQCTLLQLPRCCTCELRRNWWLFKLLCSGNLVGKTVGWHSYWSKIFSMFRDEGEKMNKHQTTSDRVKADDCLDARTIFFESGFNVWDWPWSQLAYTRIGSGDCILLCCMVEDLQMYAWSQHSVYDKANKP